jgi:hypothetical protein
MTAIEMNLEKAQRGIVRLPSGDGSGSGRFRMRHIPTSKDLTGIEARLSQVFVKDNKTPHLWPFIRYSDLYVVTSSIDNLGGEPYCVSLKGFAKVDDGEHLPVERTVYYWTPDGAGSRAPGAVHVLTSVIKSNEGIRDLGAALTSLRNTDDFRTVVGAIVTAAGAGGTAIYDAFLPLVGVVGSILGRIDDTPLFTSVLSFTDINGDFDQLGRHRYPQNTRYVDAVTTLIVRDANRDPGT